MTKVKWYNEDAEAARAWHSYMQIEWGATGQATGPAGGMPGKLLDPGPVWGAAVVYPWLAWSFYADILRIRHSAMQPEALANAVTKLFEAARLVLEPEAHQFGHVEVIGVGKPRDDIPQAWIDARILLLQCTQDVYRHHARFPGQYFSGQLGAAPAVLLGTIGCVGVAGLAAAAWLTDRELDRRSDAGVAIAAEQAWAYARAWSEIQTNMALIEKGRDPVLSDWASSRVRVAKIQQNKPWVWAGVGAVGGLVLGGGALAAATSED